MVLIMTTTSQMCDLRDFYTMPNVHKMLSHEEAALIFKAGYEMGKRAAYASMLRTSRLVELEAKT